MPLYNDTDALVTPEVFSQIAEAAPILLLQSRHYYIPQSVIHQVFEDRYQKKHVDRMMILMSILFNPLFRRPAHNRLEPALSQRSGKNSLARLSAYSCDCADCQCPSCAFGERFGEPDRPLVQVEPHSSRPTVPVCSKMCHSRELPVSLLFPSRGVRFDVGGECSSC